MILFVYCIPSPPLHCRTCCGAVSKSKIEWRSHTDCWCPFIAYRDCIQNRQPEIAACIRRRWMVVEGSPCQVTNLPAATFCCLVQCCRGGRPEKSTQREHKSNKFAIYEYGSPTHNKDSTEIPSLVCRTCPAIQFSYSPVSRST